MDVNATVYTHKQIYNQREPYGPWTYYDHEQDGIVEVTEEVGILLDKLSGFQDLWLSAGSSLMYEYMGE